MKRLLLIAFTVSGFIGKAQPDHHRPGSDTLIYLEKDSACSMFIGFYLDYDEIDFLYEVKNDSAGKINDPKLFLYNRWGLQLCEIKENMKRWARGTDNDPYKFNEYFYVFSYRNKYNKTVSHKGAVRGDWW
jgi:hypothetical protein